MVAQSSEAANNRTKRLRMVVILSRHGVRSPTWTAERLNAYSARPWPVWNVPPGVLTDRGYGLIRQFAAFDRASLAQAGLFAAHGCEDASRTYIWADTDQRTIASGKALAEGFFPGCPPQVHALADGVNDPLFHPTANGLSPAQADTAYTELSARVKRQKDAEQNELLDEMRHVLWGCAPKAACVPATKPQTQLVGTPESVVRGKGDHIVDLQGPLAQASSFAEDFLLEYADGMPMEQVGWGKVDESQLRRFLKLHSDYFELMHRTPVLARLEASTMLSQIMRTMQQAVEQKLIEKAIGPVDSKLVIIAGHDTNIAGVAALLGLHWQLDGRTDDTPPGTELTFELWQDAHGAYTVHAAIAMQTLHQLREHDDLSPAAPPAHEALKLRGCRGRNDACGWEDFRMIVDEAVDGHTAPPVHSHASQ